MEVPATLVEKIGPRPLDPAGRIAHPRDSSAATEAARPHFHFADDAIGIDIAEARAYLYGCTVPLLKAGQDPAVIPRTRENIALFRKTLEIIAGAIERFSALVPRELDTPPPDRNKTRPWRINNTTPNEAIYQAIFPSLQAALRSVGGYPRKAVAGTSEFAVPDLNRTALEIHELLFGEKTQANFAQDHPKRELEAYADELDSTLTEISIARRYTTDPAQFHELAQVEQKLVTLWRHVEARNFEHALGAYENFPEAGDSHEERRSKAAKARLNQIRLDEFRNRVREYYTFATHATGAGADTEAHALKSESLDKAAIDKFAAIFRTDFRGEFRAVEMKLADHYHESRAKLTVQDALRKSQKAVRLSIARLLAINTEQLPPEVVVAHTQRQLLDIKENVDKLLLANDAKYIEKGDPDEWFPNPKHIFSTHISARTVWNGRPAATFPDRTYASDSTDGALSDDSEAASLGNETLADHVQAASDLHAYGRKLGRALSYTTDKRIDRMVMSAFCKLHRTCVGRYDDLDAEVLTTIVGMLATSTKLQRVLQKEHYTDAYSHAIVRVGDDTISATRRAVLLEYLMISAHKLAIPTALIAPERYRAIAQAYDGLLDDPNLSAERKRHLTLVAARHLTPSENQVFALPPEELAVKFQTDFLLHGETHDIEALDGDDVEPMHYLTQSQFGDQAPPKALSEREAFVHARGGDLLLDAQRELLIARLQAAQT